MKRKDSANTQIPQYKQVEAWKKRNTTPNPNPNPFCLARNCLSHLLIIWDKFTRELLHLSFQGQRVSPPSFGKCRRETFSLTTLKNWYIIWMMKHNLWSFSYMGSLGLFICCHFFFPVHLFFNLYIHMCIQLEFSYSAMHFCQWD